VIWALYCFLRTPEDFWTVLRTCISGGGDTDSTAAMACALSGAHLGLEAIPKVFAYAVQDKQKWTYVDLVRLASQVFQLQKKGKLKVQLNPNSQIDASAQTIVRKSTSKPEKAKNSSKTSTGTSAPNVK